MTSNEIVQNFGTVCTASLGIGLIYLSLAPTMITDRYFREGAMLAGSFILTTSVLRVLVLYGYITPDEVRITSGLVAFGAVMIMASIVVVRQAAIKEIKRIAEGNVMRLQEEHGDVNLNGGLSLLALVVVIIFILYLTERAGITNIFA